MGQKVERKGKNFGVRDERMKGKSEIGGGLYNEGGRAELDSYKEEYEASLENGRQVRRGDEIGLDDDYDDGIDVKDDREDEDEEHDDGVNDDGIGRKLGGDDDDEHRKDMKFNAKENGSSEISKNGSGSGSGSGSKRDKGSGTARNPKQKRRAKHHRAGEI